MVDDGPPISRFSLQRWSRRKLAAARAAQPGPPVVAPAATAPTPAAAPEATVAAQAAPPVPAAATSDLPSVASLSFESDFSAFLQPKVDETLRRQALKKLFSDPRFNVMDGLDVYIDDYGKPDPISPELVRQLVQGRYLFDPPRTRVNAQGCVEDVPPDEEAAPPAAGQGHEAVVDAPASAPHAAVPDEASATASPPPEPPADPDATLPADPRS
jgi:hypothetical protein